MSLIEITFSMKLRHVPVQTKYINFMKYSPEKEMQSYLSFREDKDLVQPYAAVVQPDVCFRGVLSELVLRHAQTVSTLLRTQVRETA